MAQLTTKKFVIENIFGLLIVVSFVLQIIITVFIQKVEIEHFQYLKQNWERPVYHDDFSIGDTCEGKYKNIIQEAIINGTVEGGKNYFNKTIRMPNVDSAIGINSIHSVNFNLSTFNNKSLCILVDRNPANYFSLRRGSLNDTKQGGTRIGLDSLGNVLFEETLFTVPSNHTNNNRLNKLNEKNIEAEIFFSDFIISENKPCLNPYYGNKFSNPNILDYYYGDKNKCPGGKVFQNATVLEINNTTFNITKYKLLEENGIINQLKQLPDYDMSSFNNTILKLYKVPYIGLKRDVYFSSDNKEDLEKYISTLQSIPLFNSILLVIEAAFILLFLVKFMVLITKFYRQKIKTPVYVKPTLMIVSVVNCIFVCIFFSKVVSNPQLISSIKQGKIDENYFSLLEPSFKAVDSCLNITWVCLVINIALGIKYGIRTAIKLAS